jgi:hypothetical protein
MHIPELRVDPEIVSQRFSSNCSMCNCNGSCCSEGVLLDVQDKERILVHADLIKRYLEPQQINDTGKWFDNIIEGDKDFPSGLCDGTTVHGNCCVFLDSKGLCVLQKTAMAEGMDKFALKPFYCVIFPLTIERHKLTMDRLESHHRPQCCSDVPDGLLTVLDVCREEFEYIYGAQGIEEVEKLFHEEVVAAVASAV